MDKLNEFADSTIKMGESLFRRIQQSDFFSKTSVWNSESQEKPNEETKEDMPDRREN